MLGTPNTKDEERGWKRGVMLVSYGVMKATKAANGTIDKSS